MEKNLDNITGQETTTDQTFHRVCRFRGQILASEATCVRDALSRPRDTGWDSWRGGGRSIDADRRDSLNPVCSNEPCRPLRGNYTILSLSLSLRTGRGIDSDSLFFEHWKFGTSFQRINYLKRFSKCEVCGNLLCVTVKTLRTLSQFPPLTPYFCVYIMRYISCSKLRRHSTNEICYVMCIFCFVVHRLDLFELSFLQSISDVIHSKMSLSTFFQVSLAIVYNLKYM